MKKTFNRIKTLLVPYKKSLLLVVIVAIISSVFSIVGPKILGNATTIIYEGLIDKFMNNGGIDFKKLQDLLLSIVGLYFVSMIFSAIQGIVMSIVNQKITFDLRKRVSNKINLLPLKYYEERQVGDILSIITNDVDTISASIDQSFTELIRSVAMIIGIVVMMFSINIYMTFAVLLILPIAGVLLGIVVSKSQKFFTKQQEDLARINSQVEEMYAGHDVINLYDAKQETQEKFIVNNEELYKTAWKSQFFSSVMMPIMNFIGNLGYVTVSILGGWLVIKEQIAVGDILSFTQYVRNFMNPIGSIAQVASLLQQLSAASDRVFSFLEADEEIPDPETNYSPDDINGDITFDNVAFSYNKKDPIINNFSVSIKRGQKVAIVGPTGAGKTTIVKLLMRFYDVDQGVIIIDGINIKDFKRNDLRGSFGMVLQDAWLSNNTILENIRYGNLNSTDEEVIDAAILSHIDHFVRTLPEGYNTVLNEETSNISMGQRQLLTIARVMLKDPKFLILDEATSNVDTRTEILIQKAMDKLMKDKTSFIIAHRLSTIKSADLILVMNNGDIVEQGTHNELLKKKGFYEKLYNSQFEDQE